ncbi:MAG: amidohydrolase, partial [Candidatus Eremiobacteraeota bacterium]|nr:amidohydrolase [Candidatus Eremiobacteraeota bacterium]
MPPRIDFHTHFLAREAERFGAPVPSWPRLVLDDPGCGRLTRDGVTFRDVDARSWDPARRIADMDAAGIDLQVLSPLPPTFAYEFDAAVTSRFARLQNDAIAEVVRARPDRFAGLGTLALQDPDAACAELERVTAELQLSGVEIGTHAGGRDLTDPAFDAFWRRCDALGAIVFVHPGNAPGFERLRARRLAFAAGYPSETGLCAASLIMTGLIARHPRVRWVFAHGGGTLAWLMPRLDAVWSAYADVREPSAQRPSDVARTVWYDTLTFDAENLRVLAERAGTDRLVVGSDYPFLMQEEPPGATVLACDA